MITKFDIENIKKYTFVTKVENHFSYITVFTKKGKKVIPKRVTTKQLLKILNRLKPELKKLIPFEVI